MRILLLGYGNMGREIEELLIASGTHTYDVALKKAGSTLTPSQVQAADVVIDFTSPDAVMHNIKTVLAEGTRMVVGTTGWYDHLPQVQKLVKKSGAGLVYGANFSVGAHVFFRIVAHATRLTSAVGDYDTFGFEIHHTGKKDSPSGTALRTAEEVLKHSNTKTVLQTQRLDRAIKPHELHFGSLRGGRNRGFHQVTFDSAADAITINHAAHSRRGFAEGAILAAEFIRKRKGLYTFDDVIDKQFSV